MAEEQHVLVEEQHPIPQQISAFQFRLVGDMTLKQFVQIAGGAVIALLIYASGLPAYIKWPLILFSFGMGAALAFLPLEDRPLGKWIVSFFKSIYSPTVFVWQKMTQPPNYFAPETQTAPPQTADTTTAVTQVQSIQAKPTALPEEKNLEAKEQTFLQKISSLSRNAPATTITSGVSPVTTPATPAPQEKKYVVIPASGTVGVEKDQKERGFQLPSNDTPQPFSTNTVSPILGKGADITGKQAKFSDDASPPMPPARPNTVVGQVMDSEGKIIEGAILEIKDSQSRPVRALKTNKLGHFMIVTPLLNGRYELTTEKEGFNFEPVVFETKGSIISPIAIRAK